MLNLKGKALLLRVDCVLYIQCLIRQSVPRQRARTSTVVVTPDDSALKFSGCSLWLMTRERTRVVSQQRSSHYL